MPFYAAHMFRQYAYLFPAPDRILYKRDFLGDIDSHTSLLLESAGPVFCSNAFIFEVYFLNCF
jgi:hypothetical protein